MAHIYGMLTRRLLVPRPGLLPRPHRGNLWPRRTDHTGQDGDSLLPHGLSQGLFGFRDQVLTTHVDHCFFCLRFWCGRGHTLGRYRSFRCAYGVT